MNNTAVAIVTEEMTPTILMCLFWFITVTTSPLLVTFAIAYGYWQAYLERILSEDDDNQKIITEFFLLGGLISSILLVGAHLHI